MLTAKLYHLHWVRHHGGLKSCLAESLLKSLTSLALTCYYQNTVHSVLFGGRRITVEKSNYYKKYRIIKFFQIFFLKKFAGIQPVLVFCF